MSPSGVAHVVVLQGIFHLTLRSVPLPGTISSLRHSLAAGRRERAVNLSGIHNGFGWILFQACIFPQGEWNGSNFRIKFLFWNWTSPPIFLTSSPRRVLKSQTKFKGKKLKMHWILTPFIANTTAPISSSFAVVYSASCCLFCSKDIKSTATQLPSSNYTNDHRNTRHLFMLLWLNPSLWVQHTHPTLWNLGRCLQKASAEYTYPPDGDTSIFFHIFPLNLKEKLMF